MNDLVATALHSESVTTVGCDSKRATVDLPGERERERDAELGGEVELGGAVAGRVVEVGTSECLVADDRSDTFVGNTVAGGSG
jgi:hypothetical protein